MIDVFHKILIHIPALYQNLHYNRDHKLKTSETPLKSQVQGTRLLLKSTQESAIGTGGDRWHLLIRKTNAITMRVLATI